MKKVSARSISVVALISASLLSYTYLTIVSPGENSESFAVPVPGEEIIKEVEQENVEETDIILPDITLLKHVVELGKHLLPGS